MSSSTLPRCVLRAFKLRTTHSLKQSRTFPFPQTAIRCMHRASRPVTNLLASGRQRPALRCTRDARLQPSLAVARRTLFIQTEDTPNNDALKFKPNQRVLPENFPSPFLEYLSPRSTLAPPHPSPLAGKLLSVDGVSSIFFGGDYITITKDSATPWAHVKPEVFSLITEAITTGQPIVNTVASRPGEDAQGAAQDTLAIADDDDDVVAMIKELLETRIRPAIQDDGGDIDFRGFEDGLVLLKLRGACRTCDSSTVTLKNGIESMMTYYIPEVKGIKQVFDPEEEIAMNEFAKFEEKLQQQKGPDAAASTVSEGSLGTAQG